MLPIFFWLQECPTFLSSLLPTLREAQLSACGRKHALGFPGGNVPSPNLAAQCRAAQLRSHIDLFHDLSWNANAYFVSALPSDGVHSYTRVDTQLTWKFAERAAFSVTAQNLLRDHHLESNDAVTSVNNGLVKRSAYGKIAWRF
jgi:hypothetical protein